jgi:hypothetical protein
MDWRQSFHSFAHLSLINSSRTLQDPEQAFHYRGNNDTEAGIPERG